LPSWGSLAAGRAGELDIVRGLSLWGILVANLAWTQHQAAHPAPPAGPWDLRVESLLHLLVEGKFYTLFSLLFGMGVALQCAPQQTRTTLGLAVGTGVSGTPTEGWLLSRLIRRHGILLVVGIIHLTLVWFGDVLHLYALLAFPLILTRHWPARLQVGIGLFLALGTSVIHTAIASRWPGIPGFSPDAGLDAGVWDDHQAWIHEGLSNGNWFDSVTVHVASVVHIDWKQGYVWEFGGLILGRFLLGSGLLRMGWVGHTPLARRRQGQVLAACVPLALASTGFLALEQEGIPAVAMLPDAFHHPLALVVREVSALSVAGLIFCGISLRHQAHPRGRVQAALGLAGRMPLTHYLAQSGLQWFLYYGYFRPSGLGTLGVAACVPIGTLFFIGQVLFSRVWFRFLPLGPAEAAWRWLAAPSRPRRRPPPEPGC
jgi:uncharacterized protein